MYWNTNISDKCLKGTAFFQKGAFSIDDFSINIVFFEGQKAVFVFVEGKCKMFA